MFKHLLTPMAYRGKKNIIDEFTWEIKNKVNELHGRDYRPRLCDKITGGEQITCLSGLKLRKYLANDVKCGCWKQVHIK